MTFEGAEADTGADLSDGMLIGSGRRPYQQVARRILALVEARGLKSDDRLPPERELMSLLGVPRPVIREAMVALETMGIVEVLTGDGTYLRGRPAGLSPFSPINLEEGPSPLEQFQARRVVEPAVAALAAIAASGVDIARLEKQIEDMKAVYPRLEVEDLPGFAFHTTLAEISGNSVLHAVVVDLWTHLHQSSMWNVLRKRLLSVETRERVIVDRQNIVRGLRERDPDLARASMLTLLENAGNRYFGLNE